MITFGFTGTQNGCTPAQLTALTGLMAQVVRQGDTWRHGDCVGSDAQGHQIARMRGAIIHVHPPTNPAKRAFCDGDVIWLPRPYIDRNHDIAERCDHLIATPKGPEELRSGTWSTIRYARRIGRPVTIIWPDGSMEE